jgi:hypothetical protein
MNDRDNRLGSAQARLVRRLQEVMAALDRRVPQEGRVATLPVRSREER